MSDKVSDDLLAEFRRLMESSRDEDLVADLERLKRASTAIDERVNHPPHYTAHPSGIECIQITEHLNFCIGNAVKYLWRAGLKGDAVEDLRKAKWYIEREIARLSEDA